jgi:hypothetical protein
LTTKVIDLNSENFTNPQSALSRIKKRTFQEKELFIFESNHAAEVSQQECHISDEVGHFTTQLPA